MLFEPEGGAEESPAQDDYSAHFGIILGRDQPRMLKLTAGGEMQHLGLGGHVLGLVPHWHGGILLSLVVKQQWLGISLYFEGI